MQKKKNQWVNIFDDRMRELMKSNNKGEHRLLLIKICENEKLDVFEMVLYSDTRFCEFRYRTYNVMINMHKPMYLLYQQLASSDSEEAVDFQQKVLQFQNPIEIIKLLFLYEISHIITRTQKHCQDQDYLPPERKGKIGQLRHLTNVYIETSNLQVARVGGLV